MTINLKRGQVSHSTRFMAGAWRWSEARVRRFLKRLIGNPPKIDAMIDVSTDAGVTVISINNYGKYQWSRENGDAPSDAPSDAAATHPRRRRDERENEKENEKEEDPASAGSTPLKYAFQAGVIQLSQKHFDQWKRAYSHLELEAELLSLAEWASKQGNKWFVALASLLAKKNDHARDRREAAKHPPKIYWRSGIEGVT
jgi:hypothetical protein